MRQRIRAVRKKIKERPLIITMLSMSWNLAYALINGLISLIYTSYWYLTFCTFYLLLALMKFSAVTIKKSRRRSQADMLRHSGFAMFGLAFILCGLMILTIREHHNPVKDKAFIIATAAFTFVFVGVTIRNTIKAHLNKSPMMIVVRNISCASALISMLSLERAMLGTFGRSSDSFNLEIQAASGGIVFLVIVGFGINLLVMSAHLKKEQESEVKAAKADD